MADGCILVLVACLAVSSSGSVQILVLATFVYAVTNCASHTGPKHAVAETDSQFTLVRSCSIDSQMSKW